jgi:ribosomal protein S18 acetylase RimI-like enzyme
MAITIRWVLRGDAEALAEVHANAWLAAYRGLMSDRFLDEISVEAWAARWTESLSRDELPPIRVAIRDGALVGFCVVATPSRDDDLSEEFAEVVALNVKPEAWRSGIGRVLMTDALDRFRRDGWQVVSLWVVDGNDRAQRFYRRLGFEFDGARIHDQADGATELRMQLTLTADTAEREHQLSDPHERERRT